MRSPQQFRWGRGVTPLQQLRRACGGGARLDSDIAPGTADHGSTPNRSACHRWPGLSRPRAESPLWELLQHASPRRTTARVRRADFEPVMEGGGTQPALHTCSARLPVRATSRICRWSRGTGAGPRRAAGADPPAVDHHVLLVDHVIDADGTEGESTRMPLPPSLPGLRCGVCGPAGDVDGRRSTDTEERGPHRQSRPGSAAGCWVVVALLPCVDASAQAVVTEVRQATAE
jgi:hypothetical protein